MRFPPRPPQLNGAHGFIGHGVPFTEDSPETELTMAAEWQQQRGKDMNDLVNSLWAEEEGQDIAEYAVMLAVILVVVVGTLRLIGSNSNTVFSNAASALQ
jgi:Flp pilus assembly pilin Flp